jgi:hypothetical protein
MFAYEIRPTLYREREQLSAHESRVFIAYFANENEGSNHELMCRRMRVRVIK